MNKLTLRDVEGKTGISNAHLSQIETGKITKPLPGVLHKLAKCYELDFEYLLELAGYPSLTQSPEDIRLKPSRRIGDSLRNLTSEEIDRVIEYIQFIKSKRVKK